MGTNSAVNVEKARKLLEQRKEEEGRTQAGNLGDLQDYEVLCLHSSQAAGHNGGGGGCPVCARRVPGALLLS